MNKLVVLKVAKRIAALIAGIYVLLVVSFYTYYAIAIDPFGAAVITDHYLISGPIKRTLKPAISDEELMGLLRKEKSKFKDLVEINSENCLNDGWGRPPPEVVTIINEIGLLKVYGVNSPLWFSEPYSDSARARWNARKFNFQNKIKFIEKTTPVSQRSEAITRTTENNRIEECKYHSIRFVREKIASTAGLVKGIEYFPEPPLIKEGIMILPSLRTPTGDAPSREVVSDLAGVPRGFWMTQKQCAYRKIDKKWFLFICPD
jgi:hypothetical protein